MALRTLAPGFVNLQGSVIGMPTAVLYARYSTDLQSATSAEDQLRLLRQRADREGWHVLAEHADRAVSGTVRQRPGLNACLAAIDAGTATVLLAEGLDRISRDQEDIAAIFKRIRFAGARIVTLSEGDIGTLHIGMGGTISAIYIEQLAEKVKRGQIGRVAAGRIPGGLSYGYRLHRELDARGEVERGLRQIDPAQAAVVTRIFKAYAAGQRPLAIAKALNAEGIPAPRGGLWRGNAITGHRKRGNGMLHNRLYIGEVVYNRQTFRKDPATRRRVSRANDPADRVTATLPELRIIDQDLWEAVQTRLALYSDRPANQARRPRRLLSGLMRCGVCGGSYIAIGPNRWGCSDHRQTGTCQNGVTISDKQAQRRLWGALQNELLHPDLIADYLDEWRLLEAETRRDAIKARADAERRLAAIATEQDRLVDAIASGLPIEGLRTRAEALSAEQADLRALLAEHPEPPTPIAHPAMIEHYRRKIAALHELVDTTEEVRNQARALLQDLIERIEVNPRPNGQRGADLTIHGQLAALLTLRTTNGPDPKTEAACMIKMVAGVGFGRCHTMAICA